MKNKKLIIILKYFFNFSLFLFFDKLNRIFILFSFEFSYIFFYCKKNNLKIVLKI